MRDNTEQVLDWMALTEGGYVNHPRDPGGATNRGVTQRVYTAWKKKRGEPVKNVKEISEHEARKIFRDQYMAPVRFDDLPSGLDYAMADYSVNSGPGRAAKDLQRVLRDLGHDIAVDGHVGEQTLAAVMANEASLLVSALCCRRMTFLRSLSTFDVFGKGWTRRVMGEIDGQQDWDSGVIDRAVRMAKNQPQRTEPKAAPGKATPELPHGWLLGLIARIFNISFEVQ